MIGRGPAGKYPPWRAAHLCPSLCGFVMAPMGRWSCELAPLCGRQRLPPLEGWGLRSWCSLLLSSFVFSVCEKCVKKGSSTLFLGFHHFLFPSFLCPLSHTLFTHFPNTLFTHFSHTFQNSTFHTLLSSLRVVCRGGRLVGCLASTCGLGCRVGGGLEGVSQGVGAAQLDGDDCLKSEALVL